MVTSLPHRQTRSPVDLSTAVETRPLDIVVNDLTGHPFQIQLSRALVERGHRVRHLYCSTFTTPHGSLDGGPNGPHFEGLAVGRSFDKYRPLHRTVHELWYGVKSVRRSRGADVTLTANMPVLSLVLVALWARLRDVRWVLWLQDVQGGLAGRVIPGRKGRLGSWLLSGVERWALRRADEVVVITPDFVEYVERAGVAPEHITVIENWAPLDELPVAERDNEWARANGLADQFVYLYSGTLGRKHRPDLLVSLAEVCEPGEVVVVVTGGWGATYLEEQKRARNIEQLVILPFQPFDQLPAVLGSADVLVALLDEQAGTFSVPSKILSYLCAARPVLVAAPGENRGCGIVHEADAGVAVQPDAEAFVAAAHALRHDSARRERHARSARCYAEQTFEIGRITDRFDTLFAAKGSVDV